MSHVLPDLLHFNGCAGVLLLQEHLVTAKRMPSLLIYMLTYSFSNVLSLRCFLVFFGKRTFIYFGLCTKVVTFPSMHVTQLACQAILLTMQGQFSAQAIEASPRGAGSAAWAGIVGESI